MFRKTNYIIQAGLCLTGITMAASAQPSLVSSQIILGQKIYKDSKLPNIFYYVPFDYKLIADDSGKPEFSLIQMRYTGSRATGDAGAAKFNNLLQFHVVVDQSMQKKIAEIKTTLRKIVASAELRPLPVRKFSSVLVFAGTGNAETEDSLHLIKTSYAEAADPNASENNSYWNDRIISLRLNNNDAQVVESAIKNHQSVMSFSYAIYSVFSEKGMEDIAIYGDKKIAKKVKDFFAGEINNQKDSALQILMVKADVIDLNPDAGKWPSLIQKIDINEKVPAKYPLFDVYCYDFNNELRPDLYSKKIEIKATGVTGAFITTSFSFMGSHPDTYAKSIRFPYAVKFDKPFFYRVTEINNDGEASITEWKEKKEWSELLDITSSPDKIITKIKEDN